MTLSLILFPAILVILAMAAYLRRRVSREAVAGEEDAAKWNRLKYQPVDYAALREETDETKLKETVACAGGACEL